MNNLYRLTMPSVTCWLLIEYIAHTYDYMLPRCGFISQLNMILLQEINSMKIVTWSSFSVLYRIYCIWSINLWARHFRILGQRNYKLEKSLDICVSLFHNCKHLTKITFKTFILLHEIWFLKSVSMFHRWI